MNSTTTLDDSAAVSAVADGGDTTRHHHHQQEEEFTTFTTTTAQHEDAAPDNNTMMTMAMMMPPPTDGDADASATTVPHHPTTTVAAALTGSGQHNLLLGGVDHAPSRPAEDPPPAKRPRLDDDHLAQHTTTTTEEEAAMFYEAAAATTPTTAAEAAAAFKKQVHQEQWNEMLERLQVYKEQHGHCLVPKRYGPDPRLGTWVETQRVQYKRLTKVLDPVTQQEIPQPNKRLTAQRLAKLNALGFCWSAKHMRRQSMNPSSTTTGAVAPPTATVGTNDAVPVAQPPPPPPPNGVIPSFGQHDTDLSPNPSPTTAAAAASLAPHTILNYDYAFDPSAMMNTTSAAPTTTYPPPPVTTTTTAPATSTTTKRLKSTSTTATTQATPSTTPSTTVTTNTTTETQKWNDSYQRLVEFQQWHGHCLVPRKYEADPKLSTWVEQQRAAWNRDYNKNSGTTTVSSTTSTTAAVDGGGGTTGTMGTTTTTANKTDDTTPITTSNSNATVKKLTAERKHKLDAIGFCWSLRSKRIEDHWDEMFQQLVAYKEQHGDCLVPSRYEANLKLGKWVETQRYEYTKLQRASTSTTSTTGMSDTEEKEQASVAAKPPAAGTMTNPRLTPERLRRLQSIGFEWKVKNKMKRYYDKQWDGMFQRLLDFKQKYGHCNVPKRFPEDAKLGTWVHTQRIQYRKLANGGNSKKGGSGKSSPVPGAANALERAPTPTPTLERAPTPTPTSATTTAINTEATLVESPVNTNNAVAGTSGDTPAVEPTKNTTPVAETAKNDNKVPAFLTEAGYIDDKASGVANWTAEQAQSFRLTDARKKRLEEVGFCWSAREGNEKATLETRIARNSYDDQWDAMFIQLEEYKRAKGDCLVPKRYPENPKLGTWVDTQRVQYKKMLKKIAEMQHNKRPGDDNASIGSTGSTSNTAPLVGRLTQGRIRRLQDLGFVWSLRDDWAKHYEELKVYKSVHGNCNVPARYAQNRRLGIWVSAQRQQYKILQQQQRLQQQQPPMQQITATTAEALPPETQGDSGSPTNASESATLAASANAKTNANVNPKARRSAPLTQERIDLLNALGFTWTIRSRDALGESWNQRLQELRLFKQEYGHCLVPSRYEKNPELGVWVGTQRAQYRQFMRAREMGQTISTNMNEDRIRELEDLGFVWALRGNIPEDAIAAAEAAAAAMVIADQIAGATVGHEHAHHHKDPTLVGHHVEPTQLEYHSFPQNQQHQPTGPNNLAVGEASHYLQEPIDSTTNANASPADGTETAATHQETSYISVSI